MPSSTKKNAVLAKKRVTNGDFLPRLAGEIEGNTAAKDRQFPKADKETDDSIDALTNRVFAGDVSVEAIPFLIEAVGRAKSELSLRSAALALAVIAPDGTAGAADALLGAFSKMREHPFLAPALLEAIGLLAMRSPLARAQVSLLLLRLDVGDMRYLLVKAAQTIGRLDAVRPDSDLRAKLGELVAAEDPIVQAEARQQLALAELADVLLAEDRTALRVRLTSVRAAFTRAEMSEENRPDAAMFVRLLDVFLAFLGLGQDRADAARRIGELARILDHTLGSPAAQDWHGYRSDVAVLRVRRLLHITDSLQRAAEAVGWAEEWTNFAAALEELARLHAQIRAEVTGGTDTGRISAALSDVADGIFAASLGPLLARVVQQRRLARITRDYLLAHGEDSIARGLMALERAAAAAIFAADPVLDEGVAGRLAELADAVDRSPHALLAEAIEAMHDRRMAQWAEEIGLATGPLPVERPELYGDDPAVDEVVRPLLHQIVGLIREYSPAKWARLVDVLVSLVKFAHYLRDNTFEYLVCEEDGGLGQRASEHALQQHLFEWLRIDFGRNAVYEFARTGGGRPDTGVVFPEARFPIETKHEFGSILPEHLRASFVAQPDVYATAADRVAFLMILDLRISNAASHRGRMKTARRAGQVAAPIGLYHLRNSFQVASLPNDPDVPNALNKVVVLGLIPGNRPLPSSTSTYSKRPASARKARKS
jgi:hypothetical protein